MVGTIPGMEGRPPPPELAPELNGPIVAYLASELAGSVNGQIFGRRGYAYTLFQTPKPIAALYKEGGMTAGEIARNFDAAFREHLRCRVSRLARAPAGRGGEEGVASATAGGAWRARGGRTRASWSTASRC
jgi:hypothetical protein